MAVDRDGRVAIIRKPGTAAVWALPKGHPLPGESNLQTALREVNEETGLEVEPDGPGSVWSIEYVYRKRSGAEVHKRVDFYLMRVTGGDRRGHDDEVAEVVLLPPAQAVRQLTYPNEREAVRALLCE